MLKFSAFEIIGTGGNCSALVATLSDGRALFITDGDANAEPARDAYFIGLFPSYRNAVEWEDGDELIERYATPDDDAPAFEIALAELTGLDCHGMARDFMDVYMDPARDPLSLDEFLAEATPATLSRDAYRIGRAILGAFDVCADTYHLHSRG